VRFTSRKAIRESLTGRTSLLELLPMTLAETHSLPLGTFVADASQLPTQALLEKLSKRKHFSHAQVGHYLRHGGMPGVCFKRDGIVRDRIREAHLETLLMRDIQLLVRTRTPYRKLRDLLASLALAQGQLISLSELGRRVQLSTPTVIQMIQAFEDLFLVRRHGKSLFLSDCGIGTFLGARRGDDTLGDMEHFLFQELYAQLNYSHRAQFKFSPYLTRGGIRIPFIIELNGRNTIAIMVDQSDGGSEKSLKSLGRFVKQHRKACTPIVLHGGVRSYVASSGALCLPYSWVCS
jgi:predicted AAA+ superfamily ATPase